MSNLKNLFKPEQFLKGINHILCLAVDFADANGMLDVFCMANQDVLERCRLYLEHPDAIPGWTHPQVVSPRSGNRIFRP